jgi:uncharacterized membrane protein YjjB (DUF3815 family)
VIAYAGTVTMMPGLTIYRALGGAFQLARLPESADITAISPTFSQALHACLVVSALALGLVIAVRTVQLFAGDRESTR